MIKAQKLKAIRIFPLAMLITVAIDNIRNLPSTALFGDQIVFFLIFGALVFLIPSGLVSAELSSTWIEKGGIFGWVEKAIGSKTGFLAIWLQWINTMVWYPTILSFIAGTAAYVIDPHLASNKIYLVSVILIVFWTLTFINLRGIHTSANFATFCAVVGMAIPMLLIIILAGIWLFLGKPVQIHLSLPDMIPKLGHSESWVSLTAIMASYLGLELATVHVQNVKNPKKTFPKALFISMAIILTTMFGGSLAIAMILPTSQINLVDGVIQAFANFFHAYHLAWMIPVLTVMIVIGCLGNMVNWMVSPAKGLFQAAEAGFLPKFFTKQNKNNVAYVVLIIQAILVSLMCLAFVTMPSVNGSYWLLTDLSTQLYMLMYVLLFITAIIQRLRYPNQHRPYQIPGGKIGIWFVSVLGLMGCTITLIIGFFPPSSINVGSHWHYDLIFGSGIVIMILPILLFYFYKYSRNSAVLEEASALP